MTRIGTPDGAASACRALVALPAARPLVGGGPLSAAAFIAHLIACDRRLPDFRRAGREGPGDASLVYRPDGARATLRLDLSV